MASKVCSNCGALKLDHIYSYTDMALKCPTTAGGYWEEAIPVNRLNVVDIEHRTALKDQARAIRLTAQKLEAFSKDFPINESLMEPAARLLIQRRLGDIRANLDALLARFGKADR